jgi:hypothetical protein
MKHFVNYGFLFLLVLVIASCHTTYKEIGFGGGISARNFEKKSSGEFAIRELPHCDTVLDFKTEVIPNFTELFQLKTTLKSPLTKQPKLKFISHNPFVKTQRPFNHNAQNKLKKQMLRENTNSKGLNLLLISLGLFVIGGLIINTNNYAGLILGIIICGVATIVLTVAAFTFLAGLIMG